MCICLHITTKRHITTKARDTSDGPLSETCCIQHNVATNDQSHEDFSTCPKCNEGTMIVFKS